MATYNPSNFTASNKSYAVQGKPEIARMWYYDPLTFENRPFQNKTEVLAYFNTPTKRKGNFSAVINEGGMLVDGEFVGGKEADYWFSGGLEEINLIKKFYSTAEVDQLINEIGSFDLQQVLTTGNVADKGILLTGESGEELLNKGGLAIWSHPLDGSIEARMVLKSTDSSVGSAGILFTTNMEGYLSEISFEIETDNNYYQPLRLVNPDNFDGSNAIMGRVQGVDAVLVNEFTTKQQIPLLVPDATSTIKGKLMLAGDLSGNATSPTVPGLLLKANIAGQVFSGNISAPNLSGTNTGDQNLAPYQLMSQKGVANGYVPLNGSNKIDLSYLPAGFQTYKGTYDASINVPTLIDGVGTAGDTWRVTVAGTQNFGSGSIDFLVGDDVIYNGSIWEKNPSAGGISLGTANGLSLSGQELSMSLSSASSTGTLSSADWNTFNNKQVAGDYSLNSNVVHKLGSLSEEITGTKSFLDRIYIGTNSAIGTENVALKANVINTGANVVRGGQFYVTQQGAQSFTGIDIFATMDAASDIDHFYASQAFTKVTGAGKVTRFANYFSVMQHAGADSAGVAAGFYHEGIADPSNKIANKWSFFALQDKAYFGSGIAMNTYSPQEFVDYDSPTVGNGFKMANAFVGNWLATSDYVAFTNYAVKSTNASVALLHKNNGETFLNAASGQNIYFSIATANKGRIAPSGKWQIGSVTSVTTDTEEELQVIGSMRVTDVLKASNINGLSGDFYMNYSGGNGKSYFGRDGSFFTDVDGNGTINGKFTVGLAPVADFDVVRKIELDTKEPAFTKNTAFNKNFGTASGTVAEGNDSRILNGQTAFGWGNHTGLYLPLSGGALTGAVTSSASISANGFFDTSDIRLKQVIDEVFDTSLIKAISYKRSDMSDDKTWVGYSAQDVREVMPDAVFENENGMLSLNYTQVLVNKVKYLEDRLAKLEGGRYGLE